MYFINYSFLSVSSYLDWELRECRSFNPSPLSLYLLQSVGTLQMWGTVEAWAHCELAEAQKAGGCE